MVDAMSAWEWQVQRFEEIDSTNTYLRERAREGAPEGLVAVADHQTAGRGRLDRRWESPPGSNLLVSVLLRPACDADDLHLCTTAVALAAADACREAAGVEVAFKWPNDLLVGESKLAGILAEVEFAGGTPPAVVVGIGINVAWPGPPEAGGTCLEDESGRAQPVDRKVLLDHLLYALAPRREMLDDAQGRRVLADEVRRRCSTLGQRVRVVLADEELTGVAHGIDGSGRLVLETDSGLRTITAGDVDHLRPC
jgi:BirA family transcriptional regulator, biotin operon repressor / biotin---[acetyl-CoA-carboxylase] ligase